MMYETDKARYHSYGSFYDDLFSKYSRDGALNILELGVQRGGSLLAWLDYFPNANVYGVDISDSRKEEYKSDSVKYTVSDLRSMPVDTTIKYDIIIDDSDHFVGTQKFIVENYYNLLAPKGVLVIEDVQQPNKDVREIGTVLPQSAFMETFDFRSKRGRHDDFIITITAP